MTSTTFKLVLILHRVHITLSMILFRLVLAPCTSQYKTSIYALESIARNQRRNRLSFGKQKRRECEENKHGSMLRRMELPQKENNSDCFYFWLSLWVRADSINHSLLFLLISSFLGFCTYERLDSRFLFYSKNSMHGPSNTICMCDSHTPSGIFFKNNISLSPSISSCESISVKSHFPYSHFEFSFSSDFVATASVKTTKENKNEFNFALSPRTFFPSFRNYLWHIYTNHLIFAHKTRKRNSLRFFLFSFPGRLRFRRWI